MVENEQPDGIVTLEAASKEFVVALGMPIGKLILEKLTLIEENEKLKAYITKLERELSLVKSEPELSKQTWDK